MPMLLIKNILNALILRKTVMKKNLKLLILYAFVIFSFSVPHDVWGMEGLPASTQDNKRSHTMAFSDGQIYPEEVQEKKRKLDQDIVNSFEMCPKETKLNILKYVVMNSLDDGTVGKLSVVCKEWQSIIKQHKVPIFKFAICEAFRVDPDICERFLNGRLEYKPNASNDIGRIELRIADLANPLEGTFDLSHCGNAGQHFTISTGYQRREHEDLPELIILLSPRFLVERDINGSASHLKNIFPDEWPTTAPVGILWTWVADDMDCYDHLSNQTMDELSNGNLYEKWFEYNACDAAGDLDEEERPNYFYVHF